MASANVDTANKLLESINTLEASKRLTKEESKQLRAKICSLSQSQDVPAVFFGYRKRASGLISLENTLNKINTHIDALKQAFSFSPITETPVALQGEFFL